ncbi:hypothetical protein [Halomonas sp. I5-271120]|uniref:hypothetical protein n=1 Tax=Halomonas sp. I5-271120 TaxID=3061632 RepID=UPI002714FDF0|nr:hypothetical protein [Halomonas sp. I5-271120]
MSGRGYSENAANMGMDESLWLQRLVFTGIGVVCALLAGWVSEAFGMFGVVSIVIYLIAALAFAFSTLGFIGAFWEKKESDPDYKEGTEVALGLGVIYGLAMIWIDWWWIAALSALASFAGPVPTSPPRWWSRAFIASAFVVGLIQLWLNTSLIHLIGSGESLLDKRYVEIQAPLLASLGCGLAVARLAKMRGPNRVVVFAMAFLAFFHGQRLAVDAWAESRSQAAQEDAIASLMTAAAVTHLPDGGQSALHVDNRYQASIMAAMLPFKWALSSVPEPAYELIEASPFIAKRLDEQRDDMLDQDAYEALRPTLFGMRRLYAAYLQTQLAPVESEAVAQRVAEANYPALADRDTPLTRSAIAEGFMDRLWAEAPSRYQSEEGMKRLLGGFLGRKEVENRLEAHDLYLRDGWEYRNPGHMKKLVMQAVDRRMDVVRHQVASQPFDITALPTKRYGGAEYVPWATFSDAALGMTMPPPAGGDLDYTYQDYRADVAGIFESNSRFEQARGLYTLRQGEDGIQPIKAAVLPAAGILTSFALLSVTTLWGLYLGLCKLLSRWALPRTGWEHYEWDYTVRGRFFIAELKEYGTYDKIGLYGRYWIPLRVWLKTRLSPAPHGSRARHHRIRWGRPRNLAWLVGVMFLAHAMLAGTWEALLLWQQVPYALVTELLAIVGLSPGFPSFIPAFLT